MKRSEPLQKRLDSANRELDRLRARGDMGSRYEDVRHAAQRMEEVIVNRNLRGRDLEKQGKPDDAIALYEQNVSDEVDTPHPYWRLTILYDKAGKYKEEIRVLEKAVLVFGRREKQREQVAKFMSRLDKAKSKAYS